MSPSFSSFSGDGANVVRLNMLHRGRIGRRGSFEQDSSAFCQRYMPSGHLVWLCPMIGFEALRRLVHGYDTMRAITPIIYIAHRIYMMVIGGGISIVDNMLQKY